MRFGMAGAGMAAAVWICAGPAAAQEPYAGEWVIERADRTPVYDLRGERVRFEENRVEGPNPLGCENAAYEIVTMPPEGLFQGTPPEPGGATIESLGFGDAIETLRVICDTGSFDYHASPDGLVIMLDMVILTLVREAEEGAEAGE